MFSLRNDGPKPAHSVGSRAAFMCLSATFCKPPVNFLPLSRRVELEATSLDSTLANTLLPHEEARNCASRDGIPEPWNQARNRPNRAIESSIRKNAMSNNSTRLNPKRKIALYFLTGFLSCISLAPATFGSPQKAINSDTQSAASSIAGNVNIATGQGQVNNLADVTVKLSDAATQSTLQSTLTNEAGHFQFTQLAAGTYTLEASAEGFKPWVKTIALAQSQVVVEDITVEINVVDQQIEVRGENFEISTESAEASATVSDRELDSLPLAERKFREALPLTPGVIRTPGGKLACVKNRAQRDTP